EGEQPSFMYQIQIHIAEALICPLHGKRFWRRVFIYVAEWRREKQELVLHKYCSAQHRKAWYASFPRDLWPPEETIGGGAEMLRLKNGLILPVGVPDGAMGLRELVDTALISIGSGASPRPVA